MKLSTSRTLAACLLAPLLCVQFTAAQAVDDPAFDPVALGLHPTPMMNEAIGVRMYYPAGAIVTPSQSGSNVVVDIHETSGTGGWSIHVEPMSTGMPDPTAAKVAESLLAQFGRLENPPQILSSDAVTYGDLAGHLIYFTDAAGQGLTAGYLFLPTGGQRFMVFRVGALAERFDQMKPLFQECFKTIRLFTAAEIADQRSGQRATAERFLATLTPDRLRSLAGTSEWFRIYRPSPTGDWMRDEEIGYVLLKINPGLRGALEPGRSPENYREEEREEGLLLEITARVLVNAEKGLVVDTQSRLWLSWDRSEEVWSTRMTTRQDDQSLTEGETGLRAAAAPGTPYSEVVVIRSKAEQRTSDTKTYIVPEGPYLSQLEVYSLGLLLPRDGSITGEMSFRYYEPSLRNADHLPARVDTWRQADDGSGHWLLTSQLLAGSPPIDSVIGTDGRLIRRVKADGSVTEPIELSRLRDIWKRKNLPTGN